MLVKELFQVFKLFIDLEISYIENILKFEFALEKHHRKLKARHNKFNISMEKKYEMDDQDHNEEFNLKKAMLEERKVPLHDILNIKTDYFTNTSNSNHNLKGTVINEINNDSSSNEEDIVDQFNKIVFYNKEHKLLSDNNNDVNGKQEEFKNKNDPKYSDLSDNFSHISPVITNYRKNKLKAHQNKVFFPRHDSFTLPRTNSQVKIYKNK